MYCKYLPPKISKVGQDLQCFHVVPCVSIAVSSWMLPQLFKTNSSHVIGPAPWGWKAGHVTGALGPWDPMNSSCPFKEAQKRGTLTVLELVSIVQGKCPVSWKMMLIQLDTTDHRKRGINIHSPMEKTVLPISREFCLIVHLHVRLLEGGIGW